MRTNLLYLLFYLALGFTGLNIVAAFSCSQSIHDLPGIVYGCPPIGVQELHEQAYLLYILNFDYNNLFWMFLPVLVGSAASNSFSLREGSGKLVLLSRNKFVSFCLKTIAFGCLIPVILFFNWEIIVPPASIRHFVLRLQDLELFKNYISSALLIRLMTSFFVVLEHRWSTCKPGGAAKHGPLSLRFLTEGVLCMISTSFALAVCALLIAADQLWFERNWAAACFQNPALVTSLYYEDLFLRVLSLASNNWMLVVFLSLLVGCFKSIVFFSPSLKLPMKSIRRYFFAVILGAVFPYVLSLVLSLQGILSLPPLWYDFGHQPQAVDFVLAALIGQLLLDVFGLAVAILVRSSITRDASVQAALGSFVKLQPTLDPTASNCRDLASSENRIQLQTSTAN